MRFFRCSVMLLTSFLATHPGQAQPAGPTTSAQATPRYKPVFLLDSKVIIGDNGLAAINPDNIATIQIYKDAATTPARWRGLAEHGIVALTLKHRPRLETKTLASLRHWLKLAGPVRFELDGLPLNDASVRIATAGIAGLDVTRATAAAPGAVVNIRLVRTGPTLPPGPEVPGRIFIRGTAAL